MSATEDDTELRDLLIQNLENSGVLNRLKAEMRAAVFLAMEEQDRLENKTPLTNEKLRTCLSSRDGRVVASLILDFLQVFNLDFTLAVFQPEINSLNGLDGRDLVCRELGLSESEVNRNSPLLLDLIRRGRDRDRDLSRDLSRDRDEDLSRDRDQDLSRDRDQDLSRNGPGSDMNQTHRHGNISKEPSQRQIALARKKFDFYDKDGGGSVLKEDLKRVFTDLLPRFNPNMLEKFMADELRAADKTFSKTIDFQMFLQLYRRLFSECRSVVVQDADVSPPVPRPEDRIVSPAVSKDSVGGAADLQQQVLRPPVDLQTSTQDLRGGRLDLDLEVEDDPDDGDSFFDDPLPKPQKTYGWKVEASEARESPAGSTSEASRPGGGSSASEQSHGRNGASNSRGGFKDSKGPKDKTGSLHLDDDVEYDDDFNSHRSDLSKSELSIGEEIEEVSIEGPDNSDKSDGSTQDLSVSQLSQSHGADYMEDVA